jgi:hypothetical protein
VIIASGGKLLSVRRKGQAKDSAIVRFELQKTQS